MNVESEFKSALLKALANSTKGEVQIGLSDLFVTLNTRTKQLIIADDEEKELASQPLSEQAARLVRQPKQLTEAWNNLLLDETVEEALLAAQILHPFSLVFVDAKGDTIDELFWFDNDTIVIDNSLLKGMHNELDDFFSQLMKE